MRYLLCIYFSTSVNGMRRLKRRIKWFCEQIKLIFLSNLYKIIPIQSTCSKDWQSWDGSSVPLHRWVHEACWRLLHSSHATSARCDKEGVFSIRWPNCYYRSSKEVCFKRLNSYVLNWMHLSILLDIIWYNSCLIYYILCIMVFRMICQFL